MIEIEELIKIKVEGQAEVIMKKNEWLAIKKAMNEGVIPFNDDDIKKEKPAIKKISISGVIAKYTGSGCYHPNLHADRQDLEHFLGWFVMNNYEIRRDDK